MDIAVSDLPGTRALKVSLQGRLDTAGVDAVETRFDAAVVASGRDAAVDLAGVPLITSMGIRMLITAARAMQRRHSKLVLFGAPELVQEVLQTAAVDSLVALVAAESEATALLAA
jgi:anti-anti-sigma factor